MQSVVTLAAGLLVQRPDMVLFVLFYGSFRSWCLQTSVVAEGHDSADRSVGKEANVP